MKSWYLVLLVCCHWVLSAREHQATLHVVTVCDTTSPEVTAVSEADSVRVQETFKNIAPHVGLRWNSKILRGKNNPLDYLKAWIRSTRIASKDVVVFYYSGKGFAQQQTIKAAKRFAEHRIANVLRCKNPRLALAIFDCYERRVTPQDNVSIHLFQTKNRITDDNVQGWHSLFRKNTGVFIGFSDRIQTKGMYSLDQGLAGGLFTTTFLSALNLWSRNARVRWGNIAHYALDESREAHFHQEPFCFERVHTHTRRSGIK